MPTSAQLAFIQSGLLYRYLYSENSGDQSQGTPVPFELVLTYRRLTILHLFRFLARILVRMLEFVPLIAVYSQFIITKMPTRFEHDLEARGSKFFMEAITRVSEINSPFR